MTTGEGPATAGTAAAGHASGRDPAFGRTLAALLLVGLALRPQILMIGPIVDRIQADLGMSHGMAGLLGTIPVLCMGILAPLGPVLAASVGARMGVALCVVLVGGFGLLRAFLPSTPAVLLATVGLGAGTAIAGPILSMVVRARLPRHPAVGTGAYVAGLIVGGSVASAIIVPLSDGLGSWRPAVAVVSAAAGASLAGWLLLLPAVHGQQRSRPTLPRLPWRRPSALRLGLVFATQSTLFYGTVTWLASAYVERGWSASQAGGLLAYFNSIGLIASLSVPLFADRVGTRRSQMAVAGVVAVAGSLTIAATPDAAPGSLLPFAAVTVLGFGIGAFFPLALTLPVDLAADASEAASMSALMLLVGYLISSTAPSVLGLVRDVSGSFEVVLWILVGIAATMIPLALSLRSGTLVGARAG